MATNRKWKTESGEAKEEVCFVNCTAFGRQAETLSQYLHKGDPLLVEGRLKFEQWESKDTHVKQTALKVVIESFSFAGGRKEGDGPAPAPSARQPGAGEVERAAGRAAAAVQEEDDIPF